MDNMFGDKKEDDGLTAEPIYSYGTDPAITRITELIEHNGVDVVAINIATLIRNCIDTDKSDDELLAIVIDNIQHIITNLSAVYYHKNVRSPIVYFYMLPYHKMIPFEYTRSYASKQRSMLLRLCARFYKYFKSTFNESFVKTKADNLNIVYRVMDDVSFSKLTEPSFQTLDKDISSFPNSHCIVLFTHQPIDVHFLRKHPRSLIVRSYSGDAMDLKQYALKVFNDVVPFLPSTHVLLGDKELIAGILKRGKKTELINRATMAKWKLWPEYKITQEVNYVYDPVYKL